MAYKGGLYECLYTDDVWLWQHYSSRKDLYAVLRGLLAALLSIQCSPLLLLQTVSTARTCNPIVLDCLKPISHMNLIEHRLGCFGICLNKQPLGIFGRNEIAMVYSKGHLQAILSHR